MIFPGFVMEITTDLYVPDVCWRSCDLNGMLTLGQGHGQLGSLVMFSLKDTHFESPTWVHYVQNGSHPGIFFKRT